MLVVDKIYEFGRETPDAPAIVADLQPITYRTFARRIAAMRRLFAGLRQGGVALLLIDDLVASWTIDLALRSLGHTTVSIRTAAELDGVSGLDLVALITLAEERRAEFDPVVAAAAERILIEPGDFEAVDGPEPPLDIAPGDHILLTSGTTGRYKMVRHAAAEDVVAYEAVHAQREQVRELLGRQASLCLFRFGLWTAAGYGVALTTWSYGERLVLQQGPLHLALALPDLDFAIVTPAFLAEIMSAPPGAFPRRDGMQLSIVAGAISKALYRQTRDRLTPRILSSIASTEAGTWATLEVGADEDVRWHRIMPGRTVEVVGEDGEALASGALGQVRVKTDAPGYLNDPEATSRFFRDGWFYPGDLGVLDGQGRVALLGRVTDVVTILGDKRPAEPIERALEEALAVGAVCALSELEADGEDTIHIVIETPEPLERGRLEAAAKTALRGYPTAHFHFLPALPRNEMGKVQRLKLRQQLLARRG